MGIIKTIGVWLKQLVMLPSNLAKIASIDEQLKLQKELSETQQRLKEAEQKLAAEVAIKVGRMFFCNNVYWAKDENGKIEESPYCPRCFELNGKPIHLVIFQKGIFQYGKCLECKGDEIPFRKPE
jgi:formylmethanofuran dehydrogenase subunit E